MKEKLLIEILGNTLLNRLVSKCCKIKFQMFLFVNL